MLSLAASQMVLRAGDMRNKAVGKYRRYMHTMTDATTITKERIAEVIDRMRGPGGVPLTPSYIQSVKYRLACLLKRGFLNVEFLSDKERVPIAFLEAYPNSSSRSQFARVILVFLSLLDDTEFARDFAEVSREDVVSTIRAVAKIANKDINDKARKRG